MRVAIEAELDYKTEGARTILLQIEAAENVPDQTVIESKLAVVDSVSHVRVPADEGVGTRSWIRVEDRFTCRYTAVVEILPARRRTSAGCGRCRCTSSPARRSSSCCRRASVRRTSSAPSSRTSSAAPRAAPGSRRCATGSNRTSQYVPGSSDAETTVVDTFIKRQGICRDYAHLLVTLARASNIPARAVCVYAPDVDAARLSRRRRGLARRRLVPGRPHRHGVARDSMVRVGVGRDAADIAFLAIYGPFELVNQQVAVTRL